MSHSLPWPWLTAGLLALGSGCHQPDLASSVRGGPAGSMSEARSEELPGGRTPTSYRLRPAMPAQTSLVSPASATIARQAAPQPGPAPFAASREGIVLASPGSRDALSVEVTPARLVSAHAADYRWLVGYLRQEGQNRWRVRYALAGENDRYGGSLELINPGLMKGFASGQLVRVEGELVDPAPLEIVPAYRVLSLQAVRR